MIMNIIIKIRKENKIFIITKNINQENDNFYYDFKIKIIDELNIYYDYHVFNNSLYPSIFHNNIFININEINILIKIIDFFMSLKIYKILN